jgi:nucleotide-binding universal stress UspA family protein
MPKTQTAPSHQPHNSLSQAASSVADSTPVYTNILCAVDGTHTSAAAVRMAACMAAPSGHVTFLAVTAQTGSGQYAQAAISPSRAKSILNAAKRVADHAGVESTIIVDSDHPAAQVILKRACEHDLLVIGAPVGSWLGGLIIGGVTTAALSQFTTPMLVVRRSFNGPLQGRRILVASDGQDGSEEIVKLAGDLATSHHAPVTLLHVLGAKSAVRPHRIEAQAHTLELTLPDMSEVCIESGKASEAILQAAQRTDAAIVVLGSRRLRGLRALGSVSRRVVHDAPCSVLLLPPHE